MKLEVSNDGGINWLELQTVHDLHYYSKGIKKLCKIKVKHSYFDFPYYKRGYDNRMTKIAIRDYDKN